MPNPSIPIRDIIALAEAFECCPTCGDIQHHAHYCPICKKRYVEGDQAWWFAQWLRKKYGVEG